MNYLDEKDHYKGDYVIQFPNPDYPTQIAKWKNKFVRVILIL